MEMGRGVKIGVCHRFQSRESPPSNGENEASVFFTS